MTPLLRALPRDSGKRTLARRVIYSRAAGAQNQSRRAASVRAALIELDLGVEQEAITWLVGEWEPATLGYNERRVPQGGLLFPR